MNDFVKYTGIGVFLFASNMGIAYVSDNYVFLTGMQLTVVLTVYNFFGRYALMKYVGFNNGATQ